MRRVHALPLCVLLGACSTLRTTIPFRPIDDLGTTIPPSLAEGGHAPPATMPTGVRWVLSLAGVVREPLRAPASRHYELHVTLVDSLPGVRPDRVRLGLEDVMLVDDEGNRYRPSRIQQPVVADEGEPADASGDSTAPPPPQDHTLVFDLPNSYRFRGIGRVTVHWVLIVGGRPLRISSRFRS